ncbi:MAG: DUF6356 family protein [Gammaproteobacteria bacterium]
MIVDFEHLQKINKSYLSHGIRALRVSLTMIAVGLLGIIHAFFPFIFLKTVSNTIKKLSEEFN